MGDLRINILKQQLQSELDLAKKLEAEGKPKFAAVHYSKAAALYRKLGFDTDREQAEAMFNNANEFDGKAKKLGTTSTYTRAESDDLSDVIVAQKADINWDDIGNLDETKRNIKEAIILPFIRDKPPFISSPKTILLYGPPGTGKTMLAKASSNTLDATFFEARASSLLSKYYGESTKLINALFTKARGSQPSIIFMDEVDSMVVSRERDINEATRRVVGQLLTEVEGFETKKDERVIFMGATNKPWILDEAMLSRFQRKIYVPLPDLDARKKIFIIHMKGAELEPGLRYSDLAEKTEGFSGRDIRTVCQEAITAMVREENPHLPNLNHHSVERYDLKYRPLTEQDFIKAFENIKPGTTQEELEKYQEWKKQFGG